MLLLKSVAQVRFFGASNLPKLHETAIDLGRINDVLFFSQLNLKLKPVDLPFSALDAACWAHLTVPIIQMVLKEVFPNKHFEASRT